MNDIESGDAGNVLGNTVQVGFVSFGNRTVEGKVDTGATTSSLHATNIKVNGQQVSFLSEALSNNVVTLDLDGVQEVHSADHGGEKRPIVKLDITIDGKPINGASFNLNDRSNMDTQILIGQNVLTAGKFVIDPSKDQEQAPPQSSVRNESEVLQAIEVLIENNVTLADLFKYLHTAAVNRIKE